MNQNRSGPRGVTRIEPMTLLAIDHRSYHEPAYPSGRTEAERT